MNWYILSGGYMKKRRKNFILISIVFILIIGIIYIWNSNMGKSSRQIKETISFLKELNEIGAINSEVVPVAEDIQEIKVSSNGNSTVAYTLKWQNCGVDLDKDYNVIGFLEQTTTEYGESTLSEKSCIEHAERYLSNIINDQFKLKDVVESENKDCFYTINFYRYHRRHINYDDIMTVKINKYSGALVALSAINTDDIDYESFARIREDQAKKIAREYLNSISLSGKLQSIEEGYFNTSEKVSTISYVVNYSITNGENEGKVCTIIVNGRDGSVIKHSIQK